MNRQESQLNSEEMKEELTADQKLKAIDDICKDFHNPESEFYCDMSKALQRIELLLGRTGS